MVQPVGGWSDAQLDEARLTLEPANGTSGAPLRAPRVGLYAPWGGSMDEGWTRLILDRYGFQHQRVRPSDLSSTRRGEGRKLAEAWELFDSGPLMEQLKA